MSTERPADVPDHQPKDPILERLLQEIEPEPKVVRHNELQSFLDALESATYPVQSWPFFWGPPYGVGLTTVADRFEAIGLELGRWGRFSEALAFYRKVGSVCEQLIERGLDKKKYLQKQERALKAISRLEKRKRLRPALTITELVDDAPLLGGPYFRELVVRLHLDSAYRSMEAGSIGAARGAYSLTLEAIEEIEPTRRPHYWKLLQLLRGEFEEDLRPPTTESKTLVDPSHGKSIGSEGLSGPGEKIKKRSRFRKLASTNDEPTEPLLRSRAERFAHFSGRTQWKDAVKLDSSLTPLSHIEQTYPDRRRGLLRPDLWKLDPPLAQALKNWLNYKRADGSKPNKIPQSFGLMRAAEWYELLDRQQGTPTGAEVMEAFRRGDPNADELGRRQSAAARRQKSLAVRPGRPRSKRAKTHNP